MVLIQYMNTFFIQIKTIYTIYTPLFWGSLFTFILLKAGMNFGRHVSFNSSSIAKVLVGYSL